MSIHYILVKRRKRLELADSVGQWQCGHLWRLVTQHAGLGSRAEALAVRGRQLRGASLRPACLGSVRDGRTPALDPDMVKLPAQP